jgi:KAP family P-loop domain
MNAYVGYKVLLDDPAEIPGLGFSDYASALAEMIVHSRAEFAVGIFGGWGSGKTTLMRAIERQLATDPAVVPVWFTAWRYEKEPHLIVPLLDVLREELDRRAGAEAVAQGPARKAAAAIARAGRAFLAGLTLSAGVPGLEARLEPEKVIAALKADGGDGTGPLSFYQTGFVMLRDAIRDFSASGSRRVVVFVDDLDRCLPSNALDVLESMKLFFDVEGFVFVVGLDQAIAERAVALKYDTAPDGGTVQVPISGTDYVKKIFQVPFALPRISTEQLQEYLTTVAANADLVDAQLQDFNQNVRRHLEFLPGEDSVNPREVKRLINTYILQLKMLSARLGGGLDPNIVLALQCLSFRPDWRDLYDHLAADPQLFQSTLREAADAAEPPDAVWLSGTKVVLPAQFLQYVRTYARPMLDVPDLQSYVSAAESTHSTDPSLLEAQTMVNRLRQDADDLTSGALTVADAAKKLPGDVRRLVEVTKRRTASGPLLDRTLNQLDVVVRELMAMDSDAEDQSAIARDVTGRMTPLLDTLDTHLREMRRQTNIGALA